MGNLTSTTEEDVDPSIGDQVGYRILGIQENSPCADQVVPYFDFIISGNGHRFLDDGPSFYSMIKSHENKTIQFTLFNTKTKKTRTVDCVPSATWGGQGLLGLTIKFDSFSDAEDSVFHVLKVEENSPAAKAGLKEEEDFILGTPRYVLTSLSELDSLLSTHLNHSVEVFVYSTATDEVRCVSVVPRLDWGGDGCLGCGVGHGYLHRLPRKTRHSIGKGRRDDYLKIDGVQQRNGNSKSSGKVVKTPLGNGELHGEKADGLKVVKLDWNLANDATAMACFRAENVEVLEYPTSTQ